MPYDEHDQVPRGKDKDAFIAAMYRMDPDKLKALRRIYSGVTRCPECDHRNPASERFCAKCGAKLYPVEEYEERPILSRDKGDHSDEERRR